jgi:hypothetical protein
MHADLMGAAGPELGVEQAESRKFAQQAEHGMRLSAVLVDHHTALAGCRYVLMQRQFDVALGILPLAQHQHKIMLFHHPVAQLRVQGDQGAALLGQHQHARGVAIQPVHKLKKADS